MPELAPPQAPEATGIASLDALSGLSPERTDEPSGSLAFDKFLSSAGASSLDTEKLGRHYEEADKLATARAAAKARGESVSQVFRRKFMPFGDVVGTNWLPDLPEVELAGARLFGGKVVGAARYDAASKRMQAGEGTDQDIQDIATYEAAKGVDARANKDVTLLGNHFAGKLALEMGGLGKIGGEFMAGGAALRLGGRGLAALRGGRVAAAATPGVAPAVPVAPSLLSQAASATPGVAGTTALAPSMWVPMMQERNVQEGRDPNSLKGLPSAFLYGMANTAVLGRLQKGLTGNPSIEMFKKGVLGMVELQGVDAAAGVADQFLPKALAVHAEDDRWGTIGSWMRPYQKGDKEGAEDALERATVQALSFSLFARLHGKEEKAPETLLSRYADSVAALRKQGLSRDEAGKRVADIHEKFEDALSEDPYLTAKKAAEVLERQTPAVEKSGPELRAYAEKLVEVFEPQVRPAEKPPEPPPESAAAAPPAPGTPPETPANGEATPPAPPPESPTPPPAGGRKSKTAPNPEPGESPQAFHDRLSAAGYGAVAKQLTEAWYPETATAVGMRGSTPPPTPPAPSPAGAAEKPKSRPALREETPQEKVERLTKDYQDLDVRHEEALGNLRRTRTHANTGGSPAPAAAAAKEYGRVKREHDALRKELDAARDETFRQPLAAAATASKAPGVPQEGRPVTPVVEAEGPEIAPPEAAGASETASERRSRMRESIQRAGSSSPSVESLKADTTYRYAQKIEASGISDAAKVGHIERFKALMEKLPEAAARAVDTNLSDVKPHEGLKELSNAIIDRQIELEGSHEKLEADRKAVEAGDLLIPGAVDAKGTLFIDGGGRFEKMAQDRGKYAIPVEFTGDASLAHEAGHLVDGNLRREHSSTPQWKNAHAREIDGPDYFKPTLSEYARSDPHEGFAEFFRLVHGSEVPHAKIEAEFPLSAKYFKDHGLWPEKLREDSAGKTPIAEQFNEKLPHADGTHADAWRSEETTPAAAATPEPPAPVPTPVRPPPKPLPAGSRTKFAPPKPPPQRSVAKARTEEVAPTPEEAALDAAEAERRAAPDAGKLDAEKLGIQIGDMSRANLNTLEGINKVVTESTKLSATEKQYLLAVVNENRSLDELGGILGVSGEAVRKRSEIAADKLGFESVDDLLSGVRLGTKPARYREERVAGQKLPLEKRGQAAFGGFPFRLDFLEGLFGKAGESGKGLGSRLRRLFFGDLPSAVRAAKEQEIDHKLAAHAFDVRMAEKDLKAAIKTLGRAPDGTPITYENLKAEKLKELDQLLRVHPDETLAAAARMGFTPEIGEAIRSMRLQVDKLSHALIDIGAIDGPLVAVLEGNIGSYLTRQFEVFKNPEWFKKVDPAVVNRFKSWLLSELTKSRKGVIPDLKEIEAITESLLVDGTAAENPIAFIHKSKLGSKDLSILKARKDIPPELRALWGEYEDPLVNYTNSVAKMASLLTSHQFLTRVALEGLGRIFFEEGRLGDFKAAFPDSAPVKIADKASETMGPLNGLHTTPEIKRAFEEVFKKQELPSYLKWYMKLLSVAKFSKVIVSHTGQLRNFLTNIGIAVRDGHFGVSKLPDAVAMHTKDTPEARERWRKYIELGVVGEELNYRDFQETVADATGGRELFSDTNPRAPADKLAARLLKGGKEFLEKWYRYGDSFWKVYGFENELARYAKAFPELPREVLEKKVAEIVRDIMPTYSKVPEGIKKLRRLPFLAPFVSFQAEVVRTTVNNVVLALKELGDPRTRSIGAQRLGGTVAAGLMPLAAAATMRAVLGVDDDEEKALRRFLPEYQKESQLLFTGRDGKGRPHYVDLSRADPHSYLLDTLSAAMRGKSVKDAASRAWEEASKPFTSEELLLRSITDVARNKKEPGGEVYNEADTSVNKLKESVGHLADTFKPGGWGPLRRLLMGMSGKTDQKTGKGEDLTNAAVENLGGQRVQEFDVETELAKKARGFTATRAEAAKMTNELIRAKGAVTSQDLAAAAAKTDEGRKKAFEEFATDVAAAERLGMTRGAIRKALHDAGVSAEDTSALLRGTIPPYRPQVEGTPQERQRQIEVRRGGR